MSRSDLPRGIDRNLTSYGDPGFSRYLRRAFLASAGYDRADLDRPVVGIVDTTSDFTTCHRQMPELLRAVSRGVTEAGGLPMRFPTSSLGEILLSPTSMLFRNLLAMETEEMVAAQPMDAVVLLGGCDKTVPAQLMAAASADIPAALLVTGPMMTGSWRGTRLGACTDCRRMWASHRAGELDDGEIAEVERELAPTAGTCMVMGTASTMACLAETLGLMLPGAATSPAPSGRRLTHAVATGRAAVRLARDDVRPSSILTPGAFHNAVRMLAAIGGSTNAVIHLIAVARRAGVALTLDRIDAICGETPRLVDLKPAGTRYMEDLDRAGGVPAVLKAMEHLLDLDTVGISGESLRAQLAAASPPAEWQDVIATVDRPLGPAGALAVVRGTLAPDGAVIKAAAADPRLLAHRGPALVFDSLDDAVARIDDPALPVTADHVLVLRNAGPVGAGMPEAGAIPIPRQLARAGVRDMLRVSDARMSGTSYGAVVLHVAPEAAVGGPLALVENGDEIEIDVAARRLDLLVDPRELVGRRAAWRPPARPVRGWRALYAERVLQADSGADLDFLVPPPPAPSTERNDERTGS